MTDLPTLVIDRRFDAAPALVWRTWTEPELFSRWYGPGAETIVHELDVRAGGAWRIEMRMGKMLHFERVAFTAVENAVRLVGLQTVTDSGWNPIANPMMPDWPRTLELTVTLTPDGDGTAMRFTWTPHEATPTEIAFFGAAVDRMQSGWGAGFDAMSRLLEEIA